MNILIPMAGTGSRFKNAGFKNCKPLIKVDGKTFIDWSVSTLGIEGQYIFIVQKKDFKKIEPELKRLKPDSIILFVEKLTRGAVETCLTAKEFINNDKPLIISNSDQTLWWDSKLYLEYLKKNNPEGDVVIFEQNTKPFSYIKLDEKGYGIELAEKKVISNNALVGIHYYKHGSFFIDAAEELISKNIRANNEFYISLTYNILINDNKKITAYKLPSNDEYLTIGTPQQLFDFMNKKNKNVKIFKMKDMHRGWFIGNFVPSVYKTDKFEVGYLKHKKNEKWPFHFHNKLTEINYLIKGKMKLNGKVINTGDIFIFEPNVIAVPEFLEDCEIICVKTPSIPGDKHIV